MTKAEQDILQDVERAEIPDDVIKAITDELIKVMEKRIENISPDDDPSAEYGESWTKGSCDDDDWLELDEPLDEYEVSYKYSLSWRYRAWTEYWTDPVCYPSFDDMDSKAGEVYDIEIRTPDGEDVKHIICNKIAKIVNEKIK